MRLSSWQRFLPVALVLAASVIVLGARRGREDVLPPHAKLASFPMEVENWQGQDQAIPADELAVLGPGEFLLRNYKRAGDEPPINLYIAFFPSQRSGDTIHSPKNCLPGSGWTPMESSRISVNDSKGPISINRYVVANADNQDVVFYWYQAHGRVTPSEYWAKIFLVEDAIRMNRTDGALVRVITPILGPADKASAQARALRFVHDILPMLDNYIPR